MESLSIRPKVAPSVGDISALIDRNIPGVTLGMSQAKNLHEESETVEIKPICKGIAQLIGVLRAIDEDLCDVD